MWKNTESRYGLVTKLLHWSIAALILGLVWLGWYMSDLTDSDAWYNDSLVWHEALGMVVLALGVAQTGWALYSRPPANLMALKQWERIAAIVNRDALRTMVWLIPFTGYLVSTSTGEGIVLWGLLTVPSLGILEGDVRGLVIEIHYWCGYGVVVLVLVHAAAAFKHQFIDRDGMLRRILW